MSYSAINWKKTSGPTHVARARDHNAILNSNAEGSILPFFEQNAIAALTCMSLEQGLFTGKLGMDGVFKRAVGAANPSKSLLAFSAVHQ